MKFKSWNDAVGTIAARAGELGSLTLPELRINHPDNYSEANKHAPEHLSKLSRGECIEAILLEEFSLEIGSPTFEDDHRANSHW